MNLFTKQKEFHRYRKTNLGGLPWWSSGYDLAFPIQGETRSHIPQLRPAQLNKYIIKKKKLMVTKGKGGGERDKLRVWD